MKRIFNNFVANAITKIIAKIFGEKNVQLVWGILVIGTILISAFIRIILKI